MRPLPRLKIINLWDSSSSSSSDDNDDDNDIEILDNHPKLPISMKTNNQSNNSNIGCLSLLPAFPSLHQHGVVVYRNREHLLLANVPYNQLTNEQRRERVQGAFPTTFTLTDHRKENNHFPSFFLTQYQQLYSDLSKRLQVNDTILDYNYSRLFKCIDIMTNERIQYRFQKNPTCHYEQLPMSEYAIALEFYLQIDADLFYMKTCSFRGARPNQSRHQGLFCHNEPEIHYGIGKCFERNCKLCFPSNQITSVRLHPQQQQYEPVVQFLSKQKHRFVSGYEAILNCPAICTTKNIIYALTCPCGQFDYIGYTSMTLSQRLFYHRQHGNRIMREFILGPKNIHRIDKKTKCQEDLVKDGMRLYRHSARCPIAMQWFLNCNPQYWPFIPITKEKAANDNKIYIVPPTIPIDPISTVVTNSYQRSDFEAGQCLTDLPPLPSNDYTFSTRQCVKQFEIFKNETNQLLPNNDLDLYNATIIAVLPNDCSAPLQRIIEALFITHANTKLNTIGHLDGSVTNNNDNPHGMTQERIIADRGNWCHNLIRRSS